ncbi:uncharacterized protein TM35_000741160 [Trypanosoma theileri]|uniref:Mucin-associated surface protein (MASP) n=1 Tax=Trypanosoma theileri TaxID=67003 RepID=A0A1X0NGR1_9TRYP|nr:uncharacterized protein TM35_000741160 [Trypanosoma theileri]ORC83369.1 hypothetical protein TM35_000741160 [Trypanosoma theileri]
MMMMCRVMCVLAVVLCCACGYTMADPTVSSAASANVREDVRSIGWGGWGDFLATAGHDADCRDGSNEYTSTGIKCSDWKTHGNLSGPPPASPPPVTESPPGAPAHKQSSEANDLQTGKPPGASQDELAGDLQPVVPGGSRAQDGESAEIAKGTSMSRKERQEEESTAVKRSNDEASNKPANNSTPQESAAAPQSNNEGSNAGNSGSGADSQETNTTTQPSSENPTTEAPTATPSPAPNADINTIASTVQKKTNADSSSINSVWVRTAAPLLIVAVFFSATVY